jgi:hypothetical protein
MLRFPNPGSTISNFVAVYTAAFERYHGRVLSLDDSVGATVGANLATSSGYMGSEAIARSTREDRTRDPLYNQLKMYAELYRALGWWHRTEKSAASYTFTLLGRQLVAAGRDYLPLLGECALGISYPSYVLHVQGKHNLRPIAFVLRTMLACGDALAKNEMILAPLSAATDRSPKAVEEMAEIVQGLRESPEVVQTEIERLAKERSVQVNTLHNYTRFPIGVMRDCKWTEKARLRFRKDKNKSFEVHKLTEYGKQIAMFASSAADIRIDQIDVLPFEQKASISIHAHYRMLERAGFDIESVSRRLAIHEEDLGRGLDQLGIDRSRPLLFSPYQALSLEDIAEVFPASEEAARIHQQSAVVAGPVTGRGAHDHLFVEPKIVLQTQANQVTSDQSLADELLALRQRHPSDAEAADAFALSHADDTQTQFYPLVRHLFQVLGLKCDNSRPGVNYQRWDACVWLDEIAVPIEIKSPTEEAFLSTKAIRQALENKVILLARGGLPTSREVTCLIVGYQLPNERGDMASLLDDIDSAFGIKIGVIDLRTLASLAIRAVTENITLDRKQLAGLRGFLHV